jgi:hypothetical protein
MAWRTYNPGDGTMHPYFPKTVKYVAGIPADGQGNLYTPKRFTYGGGPSGKTYYPGATTSSGSRGRTLTFK